MTPVLSEILVSLHEHIPVTATLKLELKAMMVMQFRSALRQVQILITEIPLLAAVCLLWRFCPVGPCCLSG